MEPTFSIVLPCWNSVDFIDRCIESLKNQTYKNFEVIIIDNSSKHAGHKFYSKSKFHLSLQIKSNYLKKKNKISAQREIFHILKSELKEKIHALEIKII